ncbi:hypothetical protein J2Y66_002162 [Paenarthrobacter nitroguajacolicus]|nr:hypothetical protein [Paenarthrobacter nitroguajacolicus]
MTTQDDELQVSANTGQELLAVIALEPFPG